MNNSIHRISLDVHDTGSQVSISAKKGDTARSLHITLTENGKPYRIAEGCSAVFYMKKPADINGDRATVYNDCNIEGNLICYDILSANTENVGVADCEVTLIGKDGRVITSPHFTIVIDETLINEDAVVGTNEFSALVSATNEAKAITAEVEQKLANGEFVGEKGDKGDTGDRGEQGIQGEKGEKGDKGEDANPNLFANAVIGSAEGKVVQVDDVSPVEHTIEAVVHGKNILDMSTAQPISAENIEASGNNLVFKDFGKGDYGCRFIGLPFIVGKTYTFSMESVTLTGTAYGWRVIFEDGTYSTKNASKTLTTTINKKVRQVNFYIAFGELTTTQDITISKPMCEIAETATEYTPYIDPATVRVTRYGVDETDNLQTFTPNADGTVDGITSLSPTMTLLTDTEGAVIHCEYNRDTNKALASVGTSGGASVTTNGTVVSQNADFAEVAEWGDGNPDNEDRTGYFVCADVPVDGIVMKKATSTDDVKGVTIKNPAFAGNYTKDKLDANGNLLPKYSYVAIIGFVPVIDNGTCEVGGRCMPDDNGCAIPSSNSMGYQVVNRIDENRVLIIIEPNGDMVQRVKTKITAIQEELGDIETALDSIIAIQRELMGITLISFTIQSTEFQGEKGMTWREWCESDYNTSVFYIISDGSRYDGYMGNDEQYFTFSLDDVIEQGSLYVPMDRY